MKIGVWIVLCLIVCTCLTFAGFLISERITHERALDNYPVAYTEIIRRSAEEFSLDPYLVLSVMRCESSFDSDAVSNRGAIGLMQVMPDTGTWIAHKLDLDESYEEDDLYDPATNVRFGCWYLKFVADRFGGSVKEMIAAYNAGHRSVENWLTDPKYVANGMLAVIPFAETERYYQRVTTAYANYTALYPELFSDVPVES